ncbi:phage baseplate assembly protein [Komagataeibacter sucrofermentans]|uniref:Phage tail protein n=1 Tax=Komagataeibacter sucrofermentans TaxID=1053551 RepID=A0A318QQ10_9PROT|nr:hypothetical protein [Komagataeibacter sucrofermentans]PYD79402.1 hypothetical protein CFR77_06580 [Komagataeibacter sucrofermentans]GBQ53618.1 Mu-like bacteriophage tail protein GpP [Komagataeibacter sucrofermentans DSM 15973]
MTTTVMHATARRRHHDPNQLRLLVNGRSYSGWLEQRVSCGVERMPRDFEVTATDRSPLTPSSITVEPGAEMRILLGDDPVITGYVDRVRPKISSGAHTLVISGRGCGQDLVDCSAILPGMAIGGSELQADGIIRPLAAKFGIDVTVQGDISLAGAVPQFNINLGETPWDIIDRVTRWAGILCYEGADGNLVLSRVGQNAMASGVVEGVNLQDADATFSMDGRFSDYFAFVQSVDQFSQIGTQGDVGHVQDMTVPRYRPRAIISEQTQNGQPIAMQRLNWEKARRIGQSQAVEVIVDSWRDSAGTLWTPNYRLPVHIPSLKIVNQTLVIGDVEFSRGEDGTHAHMILMPPEAYEPEPNVLQAIDWQVAAALPGGAGKES